MRGAEWPVGQRASCAFQGKASRARGRTGRLPGTRGRGGRLRRRGIPALTNTIVHWKGRCAGGLVEREKIKLVRSHPWIAKEIPVRGFVFDMATGLLSEVIAVAQETAA